MASTTSTTTTTFVCSCKRLPRLHVPRRAIQEEGEFSFLLKLPNELKDRIWGDAAQEKRLLKLYFFHGFWREPHKLEG